MRVLGTGSDAKEVSMVARALHVAPAYFNGVFGVEAELGPTMAVYLLAKPAGGFRNLGLIPELARLWETTRTPYASRWEAANQ